MVYKVITALVGELGRLFLFCYYDKSDDLHHDTCETDKILQGYVHRASPSFREIGGKETLRQLLGGPTATVLVALSLKRHRIVYHKILKIAIIKSTSEKERAFLMPHCSTDTRIGHKNHRLLLAFQSLEQDETIHSFTLK